MIATARLALYTTVYPGVEKYLLAWHDSVLTQTDRNFDLWIGVDQLSVDSLKHAIQEEVGTVWVKGDEGDSPALVRQRAIELIVSEYPAVVFVDSDDILAPTRVEAARELLEKYDVIGCAMRIIDEKGDDLGVTFNVPQGTDLSSILPRHNIFGLSNSAYRCTVLRNCLPIPLEVELIDWYLVTRAWISGATLSFDHTSRMAYRQHSNNIARVLPPFTQNQILSATERVLNHYDLFLSNGQELELPFKQHLTHSRNYVERFCTAMRSSRVLLERYAEALNQLPAKHVWWSCVAHTELEGIWTGK